MTLNTDLPDTTEDPRAAQAPTLDMFLGYRLKRSFNAIHANLGLTLRAFDLRLVTYSALIVILEREGLRQAELAEALGIDRGNAVAIVDELEKRELITRRRHPEDRRSYALHFTDAGRALCKKAIAADRECEARILADFDTRRLLQLFDDLKQIEAAALRDLAERSDGRAS